MSYIRHKIISGRKYAYEVTSFRDPETKKVKRKPSIILVELPAEKRLREPQQNTAGGSMPRL